jgi:hypothetical protein
MRHGPTTENLLETARKVLRETLLPQLPRSAAYQALMVANAMAIASRRIAAGDRPEREARGRLGASSPTSARARWTGRASAATRRSTTSGGRPATALPRATRRPCVSTESDQYCYCCIRHWHEMLIA